MSEGIMEMLKFINEFRYATGRDGLGSGLPDLPIIPEEVCIRIPRETFVRFRNDYALLLEFACLTLGKKPNELSPLDMLRPFKPVSEGGTDDEDTTRKADDRMEG